jgi:hypothetical protein
METPLLKARCAGRQRNQDAEVPALTVLSLATRTGHKSGQWVDHTVFAASSSAARPARGLYPGDGFKGELCGSGAEVGDGKKKATFLREGGTRQYRLLCPEAHASSPTPRPARRIASTAAMRCPIQCMTGLAIELPSAL